MKRVLFSMLLVVVLSLLLVTPVFAGKDGVSIQDGVLKYKVGHYLGGQLLKTGYDIFGYNYQAHLYNGFYANVYLGADGFPPYKGDTEAYLATYPNAAAKWYWPYRDIKLEMKWNDAWISNKDRDGDGKLDRHYGYPTYIGSGAWETNHMTGNDSGYTWVDFVKIVAVPADAVKVAGTWYTAQGTEIGPDIWGEFAIIQEVYNDHANDYHGILYKSMAAAGLGYYQP